MTLKRVVLSVLTVVALVLVSQDLLHSWNQPQIQSRLELYQTNLMLHAAEWRGAGVEGAGLEKASSTLIGEDAFAKALKEYQEAGESAEKSLERARSQLQALPEEGVDLPPAPPAPALDKSTVQTEQKLQRQQLLVSINKLSELIEELDLRLGVLQAHQQQSSAALKTWTDLLLRKPRHTDLVRTAEVLVALWSDPPRILPSAEPVLKGHLDG
ncbi:MAG: CPBP family intramembrane metalloprotease domain-containing protein, partial [Oscillatoria sp. Prado101]|nr:CPBP family intramembrane metalloprotease domain-containing protein [Oscillatoria sp. Prado101]